MDIRNTKEVRSFAAQRLEHARDEKKIVSIYAYLALGLAVVTTIVNYLLGDGISQTGGLGNMGTRAVLSTLQTMLPLAQLVILTCLEIGYLAAMLRIARGQYASPRTLKLGFDRFWTVLRLMLTKGLIFLGLGFACIYAGTMIYMITPLSNGAIALLTPMMSSSTVIEPTVVLDPQLYGQLLSAMIPCFVICGLLYAATAIPMWYQYRMAEYVLIDRPAWGAFAALRESKKIMRHNRRKLFRLDLSLWPFYLAMAAASVLAYGDVLLPLLGIQLPLGAEGNYFLFYGLYLAAQFAIYYFLRNRAEVAYGIAYDALRPEEKQENTVVLGNIFQM